jgi:hypothetical protein
LDASGATELVIDNLSVTWLFPAASTQTFDIFLVISMRIVLIVLVTAAVALTGFAKSPKRETIDGTIIAYNQVLNLVLITFAPNSAAFVVRTRPAGHKPSRLIEIHFTYWSSAKPNNGDFSNELFDRARLWRFKLTKTSGCEPLREGIPGVDVKTGKEIGEQLPIWKLLRGAENEKLPFGEPLPCYSLKAHDFKPVGRRWATLAAMSNKSLDASGGSVFLIIIGPARLD